MYEYDERFYRYINRGSRDSARVLLPVLLEALPEPVESVLDVGCGAGAWLTVWQSLGAEIVGLDGDYVLPEQLMIEPDEFVSADLSAGFDLERRFGLVQSLEVAEHLPAASAARFVACLCRHADLVLFSAAPPGQGGENHINEQPYEYWRGLFREQGYSMYDPVRPAVLTHASVKPWYRYNTFLYVNENRRPELPHALAACRVADTEPARDLSPRAYQMRKGLIRMLPSSASTHLATLKKSLSLLAVRFRGENG